jgi:iron-sulfur cluster assembly accessory protein
MVTLSENAVKEIQKILSEEGEAGKSLRVFVEGGGCSGFMYGFDFDTAREGDTVLPQGGFDLLIDPFSAGHLKGSVIDYQGGLKGSGFQVQNPNARGTCGCGQSFN